LAGRLVGTGELKVQAAIDVEGKGRSGVRQGLGGLAGLEQSAGEGGTGWQKTRVLSGGLLEERQSLVRLLLGKE